MTARIGIFNPLPPDVHTEMHRNLRDRFMAALQQQEGYIGGYWLEGEDGQIWSVSFWESEDALKEGGTRANATPFAPRPGSEQSTPRGQFAGDDSLCPRTR